MQQVDNGDDGHAGHSNTGARRAQASGGARVVVFEYLSGGGALQDGERDPALLAMGRSMRDALAADLARLPGVQLSVAACPQQPLPPGGQAVAPAAGERVADFVARLAAQADHCWLVAPETGGLLASLQARVPAAAWRGCSAQALAVAASKRRTLLALQRQGVATPLTLITGTSRWVVKPDDGAGGLDTRVFDDPAQARAHLAERHSLATPMTMEPWVDGQAWSLSLLVPPHDVAAAGPPPVQLLSVNRQLIELSPDGALHYEGVHVNAMPAGHAHRARLQQLATQVAAAVPGLAGFVGIDFVWHPQHGPVVIELNPRLTCAYVGLSAALGRNLAAEMLAMAWPGARREAAHG